MKSKNKTIKKVLSNDGWTFVETLVVMAIVLVLTASVGFSAVSQIDKARVVTARGQIESFCLALDTFYMDTMDYPSETDGLSVLWKNEGQYENWRGPYIARKLPKDPWGNEYVYSVPGPNNLPFCIISYGKDGTEGGEGYDSDITSF